MIDNELCQLFFKYGLTLSNLNQQFDLLYQEYSRLEEDNPIEHLKYRIKSIDSIQEKLLKKQMMVNSSEEKLKYEFNAENIETNVRDVVGYRVVCPFLSDVYKVVEDIKKIPQFTVVCEKDYIKCPKENGYSSYHITILVPVQLPEGIELVKAEIQIRTITMDMLACLEHKINYKKDVILLEKMKAKLMNTFLFCNYVDRDLDNVLLLERKKKRRLKRKIDLPDFMKSQEFDSFIEQKQRALTVMSDKINQISKNYGGDNPIEHVKCRIKSKARIVEKLERQHKDINFKNVEECINDVAGIRIVCPFLGDVAEVIKELKADSSLNIIQEQDFMDSPKDNGYASYHMLVLVPVETNHGVEYTKVEIQIRTMPQEMWAILQERLCYQKEVNQQLPDDLKRLSNVLADVDNNMNEMIRYSREQQELNRMKKILKK